MLSVNKEQHPLFDRARCTEVVLGPGEMLYIPRHYWHWVAAIDKSCADAFKNRRTLNNNNYERDGFDPFMVTTEPPIVCAPARDNSSPLKTDSAEFVAHPRDEGHFSFSVNFWWGRRILKERKGGCKWE